MNPSESDLGKPHPNNPSRVGKRAKNGEVVWANIKSVTDNHKSMINNNFNKASQNLSPQGKNHLETHHPDAYALVQASSTPTLKRTLSTKEEEQTEQKKSRIVENHDIENNPEHSLS